MEPDKEVCGFYTGFKRRLNSGVASGDLDLIMRGNSLLRANGTPE